MKLLYNYHSEHNAGQKDRWMHFVLFLGAMALVLAAFHQFYVQFFSWRAADEASFWHLTLGIIYLIIAGIFTFIGLRVHNAGQGDADRYLRIDEKNLVWDLTQIDGEQSLRLVDIEGVDRQSIRDLTLTLKSAQTVIIPIYLIASQEKQEELLKVLWEIIPSK